MKKYAVHVLILLFLLVTTAPLQAADQGDRHKLGVLPFMVHSSENLDYVRSGIWDMLISRLAAVEGVDVTDKQLIVDALGRMNKKDLVAADAYEIGKNLGLDYVVWGSITKIGNSISLDGRLLDVPAYTMPIGVSEQARGMDDVIPKIGEFARKISAHIRGEELPVAALPAPVEGRLPPAQAQVQDQSPRVGEPVDVLRSERGTLTSVINPAYIMTPDILDRTGFFMSPRYPRKFKGMDIGDVDGDGKNEVVVIDQTNVMVYQKQEAGFILKQTIAGKYYDNYIALDVADINGNGHPEIIVTSMRQDRLNSFVLEYQDGSYVSIASSLRWFLRVINSPDGPLLLGQEIGMTTAFDNPIYEIVWDNGDYRQGRRMPIPQGLSVYGMVVTSLDGGRTERVIALDSYDRLNVYQKTTKPVSQINVMGGGLDEFLWRSDDVFGGSDNRINFKISHTGIDDTRVAEGDNVYINGRILSYDLKGDGKNELIIIKNMSPAGRVLQNVKIFTRSEIYGFQWDGIGLLENWKTRTIQGYVTDYQFKDLSNDGRKQIVLAVVLPSSQSIIVAYDLNL